ncbi:hypothetical protein QZM96_27775 [Burkholderia multivorans]|uniref:DUF7002 family protein n=1 Tax=Burkholderia cepacia complex TaxID=87882 RepID=UPI000CFE840F|nr:MULTISPECIES: hypothetical protein [Burkholderia cepacia complex]MDN8006886.1 hypothetical protein [Burkholderia multivorans]PRH04654.1 hypothetical protein C6T60_15880 [Burkholderia multivorans]
MDLNTFVERYPTLYHMAERGAWPSIRARGLLSTTATLDYYNITGDERARHEVTHRPEKVAIGPAGNQIILRDQKPMEPSRLEKALRGGVTPEEWYKFLNDKVFMWAQEHRLFGLLGARAYRKLEHDVLTIETAALMEKHADRIWLCPMNSGNTFPMPHIRGLDTFQRIASYPTKRNGLPAKEVVEVVVDYNIPDIAEFVVEVRRIKGKEVLGTLPLK